MDELLRKSTLHSGDAKDYASVFWGDYHTHTFYSHGKGSIEDNVRRASELGLKEIAVTDHGFSHGAFGMRRKDLPRMQAEISALKNKYPDVTVYLGTEANLLSRDGAIDVTPSDKFKLQLTVCGYHKFVRTMRSWFSYFLPNDLGISTRKQTVRNTDAYVKAIERNEIDILSHPGNYCPCDTREVARACKQFGTYFELNGKRIFLTDEALEIAANEGCEFVCDSDAHTPENVGNFSVALARMERVGIPLTQIANYRRRPDFRSQKTDKFSKLRDGQKCEKETSGDDAE